VEVGALVVPQVGVESGEGRGRARSGGRSPAGQRDWVGGEFLRGPVPLAWLGRACALPGGKVLGTALAIWFLAGLRRCKDHLKLTNAILRRFAVVERTAKYRSLRALEEAGLIQVEREGGKNPIVTILDVAATPKSSGVA